MRRIERRKKCFKILFIANLSLLLLVGSGLVFSVQSIDQEETTLQYIIDTLPQKLDCPTICPQQFLFPSNSSCCTSQDLSSCEQKKTCKEDTTARMKSQIDDKYILFYILFGSLGFFLLTLSLFVCFNKILMRRERELQLQRNQAALEGLMDYFSHISQILEAERERRRSVLTESLLEEQTDETCAVCLDGFSDKKVVILSCRHFFHKECIGNWIEMKNNCPVCRSRQ